MRCRTELRKEVQLMAKKPYKLDRVAIRMVKEPPLYSERPMHSPEAAIGLMRDVFREYDREVLCVVNLKANLQPINLNICSMGILDGSVAHPREIRQSFKPGEVDPAEANRIGYELAMRFTKGKHAFTVSTHTDRAHIHNHIIFSAITLDGERKFRNFYRSSYALRKLSDTICVEHGLSIIEERPRSEWQRKKIHPGSFALMKDLEQILQQKKAKDTNTGRGISTTHRLRKCSSSCRRTASIPARNLKAWPMRLPAVFTPSPMR